MKKYFAAIIVIVFVALTGAIVWRNFFSAPEQVACTEEAKICPDGSSVGRTGPNCRLPGSDK
jgi:cytochrome b subunit of formate dehydrogenase